MKKGKIERKDGLDIPWALVTPIALNSSKDKARNRWSFKGKIKEKEGERRGSAHNERPWKGGEWRLGFPSLWWSLRTLPLSKNGQHSTLHNLKNRLGLAMLVKQSDRARVGLHSYRTLIQHLRETWTPKKVPVFWMMNCTMEFGANIMVGPLATCTSIWTKKSSNVMIYSYMKIEQSIKT